MACYHCGGNHFSDYCMGYNSDSMNRNLNEVNEGIDRLAAISEKALEEASDHYERISDDIANAGFNISDSINESTIVNRDGYDKISKSIEDAGHEAMIGSIIAGVIISSALVGIGAILQYREQMDQLRHKERLRFDEESSDAGRARRELKTASTLLFVGDPKQADRHILKSLKYFPTSAETFRLKSIIESRQDKHKEAIISLKAALKLTEENHLIPSLLNIDGSITEGLYERVYTSSVTQISQELSMTGKVDEALEYLDTGIGIFNENTDLQFQRIRTLSKSKLWENKFEGYITNLVDHSPKHYNILFSDLQLRKKKKDIHDALKRIKLNKEIQFQNKNQALGMLSQGRSEMLYEIDNNLNFDNLSYLNLVSNIHDLTEEIKRYVKK